MKGLVQDATNDGAKVVIGGAPHSKGGNFYQPTLLDGITSDMRIANQEIFGPVASVIK